MLAPTPGGACSVFLFCWLVGLVGYYLLWVDGGRVMVAGGGSWLECDGEGLDGDVELGHRAR